MIDWDYVDGWADQLGPAVQRAWARVKEAVNQKAQALQDQAPGFVFRAAGPVEVAQNLALISWQFGPEGASPAVSGKDILIVEDGRIAHLYTLLDSPA